METFFGMMDMLRQAHVRAASYVVSEKVKVSVQNLCICKAFLRSLSHSK